MRNAKEIYKRRKIYYERLLKKQKQTINFISILRFIVFVTTIGFSIYFYTLNQYYLAFPILFTGIAIFIVIAARHSKAIVKRNLAKHIYHINIKSIERLLGGWREFSDTGKDFKNGEHNFSDDLDIFGDNSLYQWINTAATPMGRSRLRDILAYPKLEVDEILHRQQGIEELSKNLGWRQKLNGEILMIPEHKREVEELIAWVSKENEGNKGYLKFLSILLPLITSMSILYFFIVPHISYTIPLIFIAVNAIILKLGENIRNEVLNTAYKYKEQIKVFYRVINHIEQKKFKADILNSLKQNLVYNNKSASKEIRELVKIVDKISDRSNLFSVILNLLLLWDYHLIFMLENWKKNSGIHIEKWLNTIGEFEALSSLAIVNFDNENWTLPMFNKDILLVEAVNAAHPLLPKDAISNSLNIGKENNVILVTGSNMSGKSTFLRTIGINLVLAYAGTKVCAEKFTCSLMDIYTCMRISDNLEKNISSFYAEILRIKNIVAAVKERKPIFFLLDEIFKGTNSIDRHIGAEALINKLSKENALGFISTHDLELGDLEKKNRKIKNYHFQEHYKDNKISFDYKLREGVSTTRNAIYLMKMAGLDVDSERLQ